MKHRFIIVAILLLFLIISGICTISFLNRYKNCDFVRDGQCLPCNTDLIFPVGYKENCTKCPSRTAHYIDNSLFPIWLCTPNTIDTPPDSVSINRKTSSCPTERPLKDVVGNCYSCDTNETVRISQVHDTLCSTKRYTLPDGLLYESAKCPSFEEIKDPEVCVACHGIIQNGRCIREGINHFCNSNTDCLSHEWCYPFKISTAEGNQGVCTTYSHTNWSCSHTDGYNLEQTELFCQRQGAHIPTLEEITNATEDLSERCPSLDIWTFFKPDGVVWLESFTQEFLFTREGESKSLGGHTFHALCHKD